MLISNMTYNDVEKLVAEIEAKTKAVPTLDEACQKFVEGVYDQLKDSIVLLRIFITLKQEELTKPMQSFTEGLAQNFNLSMLPHSFVWTLMGTAGKKPEWNDRAKSNGHVGIPLVSEEFVNSIPMPSALLQQLGFNLGWTVGGGQLMAQKMGRVAGTFYVDDALTVKDSKGRFIVTAQDFVREHGVKTVFGVGYGYANSDRFATILFFLNETISKGKAVWFQTLTNPFRRNTQGLINSPDKFFK